MSVVAHFNGNVVGSNPGEGKLDLKWSIKPKQSICKGKYHWTADPLFDWIVL